MDTTRRRLAAGSTALILVSGACSGDDATVKSGAGGAPPATTAPAVAAPPMFPAGTTMAAIQAKGRLVVGTRFDLSGFGVKNASTGVVEGFDVEIAKAIAAGIFGGTPSDAVKRIDFQDSVAAGRRPSRTARSTSWSPRTGSPTSPASRSTTPDRISWPARTSW